MKERTAFHIRSIAGNLTLRIEKLTHASCQASLSGILQLILLKEAMLAAAMARMIRVRTIWMIRMYHIQKKERGVSLSEVRRSRSCGSAMLAGRFVDKMKLCSSLSRSV